jgi:hypothetical protein
MITERLDELYAKLASPDFANPSTGNLTFPSYTYVYDPSFEHEVSSTLNKLASNLIRPNAYVDTLVINIFEFFLEYMKSIQHGNHGPLLDFLMEKETTNPAFIKKSLAARAQSDQFFEAIHTHIQNYLNEVSHYKKSYVIVHGFSTIYPYLRTKHFLIKMERYVQGYKLIVFYPGVHNRAFSLFGKLKPEPYRPTKLIEIHEN